MGTLLDRIRTRLVPALLTAVGVSLVAAGLLWYTDQADANQAPTLPPARTDGPVSSSAPPTIRPVPSNAAASPSAVPPDRVATRIVIPALGIDLPVVEQPSTFPYCNVAMWFPHDGLVPPGAAGSTYIDAHARTGMFLPLLTQSQVGNGKAMLGMLVEVYTSDDMLFIYEITEVVRHVPPTSEFLDRPLAAKDPELWLQTSEGPNSSYPKLQVVAKLLSGQPADHLAAHPTPHVVVCT